MAGNKLVDFTRSFKSAVDSFYRTHPLMAFAVRIALVCLVYRFVGYLSLFFLSGEAYHQVTSPPNVLPPLFFDNSTVIDLRHGDLNYMSGIVQGNYVTLVLFYARWCPHSRRLARRFENVARILRDQVAMVAIDCWLPDGECRRSVKSVSYPVILAHVMDQRIAYLQGWREDEILSFAKRLLRPLHHISSERSYRSELQKHNVMFVGRFNFSGTYWPTSFREYHRAALLALHREPLNDPPFAIVTDSKLAVRLGLPASPSITAVSYHRGNQKYTGLLSSEGISNWSMAITEQQVFVEYFNSLSLQSGDLIHKPALFLFLPLNYSRASTHIRKLHVAAKMHNGRVRVARQPCFNLNYLIHRTCSHTRLPPFLLQCPVTDENDKRTQSNKIDPFELFRTRNISYLSHSTHLHSDVDFHIWMNATPHFVLHPLKACHPLNVSFYYIDSLRFESVLHSMGYHGNSKDSMTLALLDFKNELQFVREVDNSTFSYKDVGQFIDDVTLGKVPPLLRSSPAPVDSCLKSGSVNSGCIIEVTSDTFDQIVMDNTKDVLLVHYALWCVACTGVWPIMFDMAELLKSQPSVVIARLDGDSNDLPPCHKAYHYPTIVLYPAHRKSRPIWYHDDAASDSYRMLHFLQKHGTFPISIPQQNGNSDLAYKDPYSWIDWSHEGWLLWIQSQKQIKELELNNRNLSEKLKELQYEVSQLNKKRVGRFEPSKEADNEMYLKLQNVILQNFKTLLGDTGYQDPTAGSAGLQNIQNASCDIPSESSEAKQPVEDPTLRSDQESQPNKEVKTVLVSDDAELVVQVMKFQEEMEEEEEDEQPMQDRFVVEDDAGLSVQGPPQKGKPHQAVSSEADDTN